MIIYTCFPTNKWYNFASFNGKFRYKYCKVKEALFFGRGCSYLFVFAAPVNSMSRQICETYYRGERKHKIGSQEGLTIVRHIWQYYTLCVIAFSCDIEILKSYILRIIRHFECLMFLLTLIFYKKMHLTISDYNRLYMNISQYFWLYLGILGKGVKNIWEMCHKYMGNVTIIYG